MHHQGITLVFTLLQLFRELTHFGSRTISKMTVAIVCAVSSCTPNHVDVLNAIPPTIAVMNGPTLSSKAGCWEIPSGPDFQEVELGLMEPPQNNQTSTKTEKTAVHKGSMFMLPCLRIFHLFHRVI